MKTTKPPAALDGEGRLQARIVRFLASKACSRNPGCPWDDRADRLCYQCEARELITLLSALSVPAAPPPQARECENCGKAMELVYRCEPCGTIRFVSTVAPPPQALIAMVDGRCGCSKCIERTEDIYRMIGGCVNCGAKPILMLFRSGDPSAHLDCPVCGKWHGVQPQRLATVDEIPDAIQAVAPPPQEQPQEGKP